LFAAESETVSSQVSFNLRPAGEPLCESDIYVIISVDKNARVTHEEVFMNNVYR
jgi:hypothetical protein